MTCPVRQSEVASTQTDADRRRLESLGLTLVQPDSFGYAVEQESAMDLQGQVTQILSDFGVKENAPDELLPLVYDQLRAIAQSRMMEERVDHTLEATALVHEAYMKLVGAKSLSWESRGHFFAIAAEAMRRILIDHARRRDSQKRGGGRVAVPLSVVDLSMDQDPAQVLAVDEALGVLEAEDERCAEVIKLRFFAGLSVAETAEVMGVSERTVMREWSFGRARLYELLGLGLE